MSQVLELATLQSLDDEVATLRVTLADIERRLEGDEELIEARDELIIAEQELANGRRDQRRLEGDIQTRSAHIQREETKLYDGSVKATKELVNLQQEVENLKAHRGEVEDQLLGVLERVENAAAAQVAIARVVTRLEARWAAQSDSLRQEHARLVQALARAEARRDAQRDEVDPRGLRLYDSLRERRGSAVAKLKGASCQACRVAVPDAVRRRVVSSGPELAQCPNCERILTLG
jgi:predicted  nucleic acid-binding Zn-ribbon protein